MSNRIEIAAGEDSPQVDGDDEAGIEMSETDEDMGSQISPI